MNQTPYNVGARAAVRITATILLLPSPINKEGISKSAINQEYLRLGLRRFRPPNVITIHPERSDVTLQLLIARPYSKTPPREYIRLRRAAAPSASNPSCEMLKLLLL
ncbi:hypothetical protein EVAR_671_1 [Eumeta japonica]|uniref:Uncharacterized protein n=1 Tax=Eumeta variegata TaxID=151549 RepID=A0A4C1SE97_EUMVA|nr:hypothetical protein EVAR_671_1 [Eumeta japonica]